MMDEPVVVAALAALAHPQRLRLFRALVREGPDGMTAGALADVITASPAAASFHLKELDRAGLIHATRSGRYVRYAIHVEGMRELLEYLTKDCCQGQPELCGDAFAAKKPARVCKGEKNAC
jgi:DNA-binding transcriptional ArsR family regulator